MSAPAGSSSYRSEASLSLPEESLATGLDVSSRTYPQLAPVAVSAPSCWSVTVWYRPMWSPVATESTTEAPALAKYKVKSWATSASGFRSRNCGSAADAGVATRTPASRAAAAAAARRRGLREVFIDRPPGFSMGWALLGWCVRWAGPGRGRSSSSSRIAAHGWEPEPDRPGPPNTPSDPAVRRAPSWGVHRHLY